MTSHHEVLLGAEHGFVRLVRAVMNETVTDQTDGCNDSDFLIRNKVTLSLISRYLPTYVMYLALGGCLV